MTEDEITAAVRRLQKNPEAFAITFVQLTETVAEIRVDQLEIAKRQSRIAWFLITVLIGVIIDLLVRLPLNVQPHSSLFLSFF